MPFQIILIHVNLMAHAGFRPNHYSKSILKSISNFICYYISG